MYKTMSNYKQVRFASETTIINNKSKIPLNPEDYSGENGGENETLANNESSDDMWEKLVLYYLSRLKGLCDWRSHSLTAQTECSISNACEAVSSSEDLEEKIVQQVTQRALKHNCHERDFTDVGTYMAAGYQEGKQQAVKIVIRSLKFGVLTGILKKNGDTYWIKSKYSGKWKLPHCKLLGKHKRRINKKYGNMNMTLRSAYKKRKNTKSSKVRFSEKIEYRDGHRKQSPPFPPRRRSSSDTSSSKSSFKKAGPSARRKNKSRVVIKKPIVRKPPRRKRDRSQTKSPTPSRSRSITPNKRYKPRRLNYFTKYHTPVPKRCSSVLSSISSINSLCSGCRRKRKRSISSDYEPSKNVKKFKFSARYE